MGKHKKRERIVRIMMLAVAPASTSSGWKCSASYLIVANH
jgi:hypothetical protein